MLINNALLKNTGKLKKGSEWRSQEIMPHEADKDNKTKTKGSA